MTEERDSHDRGAAMLAEAVDLHRAGHLKQAATRYREVLTLYPGDPDVLFLAGSVSHGLGRSDEALTLLSAAARARPGFVAALNNIGMVHRAGGREAEAADRFREAIAADATFAPAWRNLGDALKAMGRLDEAVEAYRTAVSAEPGNAEACNSLGMGLRAQGDRAGALAWLRRSLELSPNNPVARYNLCTLLLELRRPEEVMPLAGDSYLGVRMAGGLLACRAVAAGETGDAKTVSRLQDLERLIRVERFQVPSGYADMASFNAALADFVTRHPTLCWEPDYQSTRRGSVTRDLLVGDRGPVAVLETLVRGAVERYVAALAEMIPGDHPLLVSRPAAWRLGAWAVVMGQEGHQAPHIHPAGWLSSVYYVQLPGFLHRESAKREGWIEFGRPPEAFRSEYDFPTRLIRPEEGLFLLFPSYLYHRTLPYQADEARISIAFDVEPASSGVG